MAVFYNKEKAKIGTLTGTIIHFPKKMNEENDPAAGVNKVDLPAGYLRCDGSVLNKNTYPVLADMLGTGNGSRFRKTTQALTNDQFQLPDLRQKHIRATSSSNIGQYNHLYVKDANDNDIVKAGVALDVIQNIPSPYEITYTGKFFLPSQSVDLRGEPSFTRSAGAYTYAAEITKNMVQPHAHHSLTTRIRQVDKNSNEFASPAQNHIESRSSLEICAWFANTRQNLCYAHATYLSNPPNDQSYPGNGYYWAWGMCWTGCESFMSSGYCLWPAPGGTGCPDTDKAFGFKSGNNPGCNHGGSPTSYTTIGNITYTGTWHQDCQQSWWNIGSINGEDPPTEKSLTPNYSFYTVPFSNEQFAPSGYDRFGYGAAANQHVRTGEFGDNAEHRHRLPFDSEEPHTYKMVTESVEISANTGLKSTINISINEDPKADEFIQPYIICEYLIKT